jgi:hypothetical protein
MYNQLVNSISNKFQKEKLIYLKFKLLWGFYMADGN